MLKAFIEPTWYDLVIARHDAANELRLSSFAAFASTDVAKLHS